MFTKSKLNVFKWIAILPQIAGLVGDIVDSFKDDKRLDASEILEIGEKLVAIVASVAAPGV